MLWEKTNNTGSWKEEVCKLPKMVEKKEEKVAPQKAEEKKGRGADIAVFTVLLVIIIFIVLMMLVGVIK
jgi:t-SNARE complex subunit (syntaxin)